MRPGRAADLPAVLELWRSDLRAGRRDSLPRRSQLDGLTTRFDWAAKSRVVEDRAGRLCGVVLVSSHASPDGPISQVEAAAVPTDSPLVRELTRWGLALSRASGAVASMTWVGRGHGDGLRAAGLELARPWWRMDRSLTGPLPAPLAVPGYELIDGTAVAKGGWSEMHNRSFADHYRFSERSEEELVAGKSPELCLMAVAAGSHEPAAVALGQVELYSDDPRPQPVGVISSVGTVPEHRRRGLARWLVAELMDRLRRAGAAHASLYVDALNHTRAYDVYTRLGFVVGFEAEVWEASFR
jgi:ribosomal protein S18 acetylase RimI-like enzyme